MVSLKLMAGACETPLKPSVHVHVHVKLPSRQDAQPQVPWRHNVGGAECGAHTHRHRPLAIHNEKGGALVTRRLSLVSQSQFRCSSRPGPRAQARSMPLAAVGLPSLARPVFCGDWREPQKGNRKGPDPKAERGPATAIVHEGTRLAMRLAPGAYYKL